MNINDRFKTPYRMEEQPMIRIGVVTEVHTTSFTANVRLDGTESKKEVPILGMYGAMHGSDLVWLHDIRGATVVLILINSEYYILTTVPGQIILGTERDSPQGKTSPHSDMSDAVIEAKESRITRSFNPNRPKDLMSGDKLIRASDGAEVGVFRGGVAKLKASAACQFILAKYRDLARLVARRFQIFTDFGEVEFFHREGGKVGMEIRGGADLASETHPSKNQWTALVTIGHREGADADRIHIEARDSAGASQATVTFKNDGNLDIYAKGAVNMKSEGPVIIEAAAKVDVKAGQINLN